MESDDDLTITGMSRIIAGKRAVAEIFKDDRENCREAWVASGFATELALKQVIMRVNGYNIWPSRELRPDLHVHNLRSLLLAAGLTLQDVPIETRPAMRLSLDWIRGHDYTADRMPRRIARDMFEATFGKDGVVTWLSTLNH